MSDSWWDDMDDEPEIQALPVGNPVLSVGVAPSSDRPVALISEVCTLAECEASALYGALVDPGARRLVRSVFGKNGSRFFASPLYAKLYNAMVENGHPETIYWDREVFDWLERDEDKTRSGMGRMEVLNIFSGPVDCFRARYYAERVLAEGKKRLAAEFGNKILLAADTSTPAELHRLIEEAARNVAPQGISSASPIAEIIPSVIAEIDAGNKGRVMTGFPKLDEAIGGLAPGNMFVIGAATGRGKTAFGLNVVANAANAGLPVAFFALEMSSVEVVRRLISIVGNVVVYKDLGVKDQPLAFADAVKKLGSLPITISAGQGFNLGIIEGYLSNPETAPKLIVVDYLQLMESSGNTSNRQEQVAEVSRGLKRLAMRLGIPVIVLSQLRRLSDTEQADAKPSLHHLRESGAIEQDADQVLLLSNGVRAPGEFRREVNAELAKNRHGPTADLKLEFYLQTQRMFEQEGP